jgi:endonuclease/exonuclease/phosphatase family metal-dependent hydrolase
VVAQAIFLRDNNFDIVMLQEVTGVTNTSGHYNVLEYLSSTTGLPYIAFVHTTDNDGGPFGNAIISRFPLYDVQTWIVPKPFGTPNTQDRGIVRASVDLDNHAYHLYSTHYSGYSGYRKAHSEFLRDLLFPNQNVPTIIGVDMNMGFQDSDALPLKSILTDSFEYFHRPIDRPGPPGGSLENIDHLLFSRVIPPPVRAYADLDPGNVTDHWVVPLLVIGYAQPPTPEPVATGQTFKVLCAHRKNSRQILSLSGKDKFDQNWLHSYDDVIKNIERGYKYTINGKELIICRRKTTYLRTEPDRQIGNNLGRLKSCD